VPILTTSVPYIFGCLSRSTNSVPKCPLRASPYLNRPTNCFLYVYSMNFSSSRPRVGACPFCNQSFKSAGTLANHIEREHRELKHHLSKRKRSNTNEGRSTSEMQETDVGRPPHSQDFEIELGRLFSEFPDFSPENEALERIDYVDITYDIVMDNEGAEALPSGTNESIEDLTTFPAGRKVGKATSASPFIQ